MSNWESIGKSNEWYTPKYIFDCLGCKFDCDVSSPVDRTHCCVPARSFITENSLEKKWHGFIWMNPPFGNRNGISSWLTKMNEHRNGISLTPDRTSATWWQVASSQADAILFVHGKIKFLKPDGNKGNQPSNGTSLMAYGEKGVKALLSAQRKGLGSLFIRINTYNND